MPLEISFLERNLQKKRNLQMPSIIWCIFLCCIWYLICVCDVERREKCRNVVFLFLEYLRCKQKEKQKIYFLWQISICTALYFLNWMRNCVAFCIIYKAVNGQIVWKSTAKKHQFIYLPNILSNYMEFLCKLNIDLFISSSGRLWKEKISLTFRFTSH